MSHPLSLRTQAFTAQVNRAREQSRGYCGCLAGLQAYVLRTSTSSYAADEFMELLEFLATVPLFRQLPRDDLPKVVGVLQRQTWPASQRVVKQGSAGRAFFVVRSGKAFVVVRGEEGEERVRAKLRRGDYWGEKTLTQEWQLEFSIVPQEGVDFVTLSLTRADFERLCFGAKLTFPRRPAIYDGQLAADMAPVRPSFLAEGAGAQRGLTAEEEAFAFAAVGRCRHLRALAGMSEDVARQLVGGARRVAVPPGAELARGGELAREFYVVFEGSFDLIPRLLLDSHSKSAEAVVASTEIYQAMARKQDFVVGLDVGARLADVDETMADSSSVKLLPSDLQRRGAFAGLWQRVRGPRAARTRAGSDTLTLWERCNAEASQELPISPGKKAESATDPAGLELDAAWRCFQVGDRVRCLRDVTPSSGGGAVESEGRMIAVPDALGGTFAVELQGQAQGCKTVHHCAEDRLTLVERAEDLEPTETLRAGDTFGDVALLFNASQVATIRAREQSTVFAIDRRHFKACIRPAKGRRQRYKGYIRLLDEVACLSPLLESERRDLARNVAGQASFAPGERVVSQGKAWNGTMAYIIEQGTCSITCDGNTGAATLGRGAHFGYAASPQLGPSSAAALSVVAGAEGMTCIMVHGELLRELRIYPDTGTASRPPASASTPPLRKSSKLPRPTKPDLWSLRAAAKLGEGGFGTVFLLEDPSSGSEYALKRLSRNYVERSGVTEQVRAERDVLSILDSPFIVQFYHACRDNDFVYLLLEAATGGHLLQLLAAHPVVLLGDRPRGSAAMFYVACVASALEYLHERHIAYRDVKPENVLLDAQGYAKLCDFGFARFVLDRTYTVLGTPDYMAPEIIDAPHAHSMEVDWWALGVLTFELLTGRDPWNCVKTYTGNPVHHILAVRRRHGGRLRGLERLPLAGDFVSRLITVERPRRLGSRGDGQEVRAHRWFTTARFDFAALAAKDVRSPHVPRRRIQARALRWATGDVAFFAKAQAKEQAAPLAPTSPGDAAAATSALLDEDPGWCRAFDAL